MPNFLARHYQNILSPFKCYTDFWFFAIIRKDFWSGLRVSSLEKLWCCPLLHFNLCTPTYSTFWFTVQLLVDINSLLKGREELGHLMHPTTQQWDHTESATTCCRGEYKKKHRRFPKMKTPASGEWVVNCK